MATQYPKALKTITITTFASSDSITVADTATNPAASNALAQFLAGQTMVLAGETITYIPFHAVLGIDVSTRMEHVNYLDAVCDDVAETGV